MTFLKFIDCGLMVRSQIGHIQIVFILKFLMVILQFLNFKFKLIGDLLDLQSVLMVQFYFQFTELLFQSRIFLYKNVVVLQMLINLALMLFFQLLNLEFKVSLSVFR